MTEILKSAPPALVIATLVFVSVGAIATSLMMSASMLIKAWTDLRKLNAELGQRREPKP